MRKLVLLFATVAAATGCSPVKDGFVMRQWSENMRELGIHPIFPPREDVYVGDVYVSESPAAPGVNDVSVNRSSQLALKFASIDVEKALDGQYKKRPEFPANNGSQPKESIFKAPQYPRRLKTVAFPGFLRATASGADVAALVPVDGLPVGLGAQLSDVKTASVTVSSAESASLPWIDLAASFQEDNLFVVPGADSEKTRAMLKSAAGRNGTPAQTVDVTVISEVFYARSFDVTMHVGRDAAAKIEATLPGSTSGKSVTEAVTGKADSAVSAGASTPGAKATDAGTPTATELAAGASSKLAANRKNASDSIPGAPGVSVGFRATAAGDIGLRRTYENPIAIGYRGATYRVDLASGEWTVTGVPGVALSNAGKDAGKQLEQQETPDPRKQRKN